MRRVPFTFWWIALFEKRLIWKNICRNVFKTEGLTTRLIRRRRRWIYRWTIFFLLFSPFPRFSTRAFRFSVRFNRRYLLFTRITLWLWCHSSVSFASLIAICTFGRTLALFMTSFLLAIIHRVPTFCTQNSSLAKLYLRGHWKARYTTVHSINPLLARYQWSRQSLT